MDKNRDQAQNIKKIQNIYHFENVTEEQLFNKISKELRCTVCQNQSIFDSMAPIALDLRREVYRQVRSGHSETEIIEFVVGQYGKDILYTPPIEANTSLLWLGPLLMLLLGSIMLVKHIRDSNKI